VIVSLDAVVHLPEKSSGSHEELQLRILARLIPRRKRAQHGRCPNLAAYGITARPWKRQKCVERTSRKYFHSVQWKNQHGFDLLLARCAIVPPRMERAGDFLGKVLGSIEQPGAGLAWLSSTWPTIVGKSLAAHTRPVRCGGKCLELSADSKAWQQQVETMKRELCDRINRSWGGSLVREVKFVAHTHVMNTSGNLAGSRPGPARISHEFDNQHLPFIRRRRA
jgi:Dna[CI] antecedent, DciA